LHRTFPPALEAPPQRGWFDEVIVWLGISGFIIVNVFVTIVTSAGRNFCYQAFTLKTPVTENDEC